MIKKRHQSRLSLVLAISLLLTLLAPAMAMGASAASFADTEQSYAKNEIQALANAGVVSGYEDGTFKPQNAMTRAELAKIIALAMGYQEAPAQAAQFKDIPSGAWYAGYVGALVSHGITEGTSPTTFSPGASVTREQLVVLFMRAMGLTEEGTIVPADVKLTDLAKISAWAKELVSLGYKIGFVKGIDNGDGTTRFEPQSVSERQALARLAYEFINNKATYQAAAEKLAAEVKNPAGTPSASTSPSATPKPSAGGTGGGSTGGGSSGGGGSGDGGSGGDDGGSTPEPTPTATPTPTPSNGSTPTPTPSNGSTPTPTPSNGSTPTPTPSNGNTPTPTPSNGSTPTPVPTSGTPVSANDFFYLSENAVYLDDLSAAKVTANFNSSDVTETAVWTSADTNVAKVEKGRIIPVTPGSTIVTALYGGRSASVIAQVSVNAADAKVMTDLTTAASSVTFSDSSPSSQTIAVTAHYSDGTTADVTDEVNWVSYDLNVVSVSKGVFTPVEAGTAQVEARLGGFKLLFEVTNTITAVPDSLSSLELQYRYLGDCYVDQSGELVVYYGGPKEAVLLAVYGNGARRNVSETAVWSTSDATVASATYGYGTNNFISIDVEDISGTALITAEYGGLTLTIPVRVKILDDLKFQVDSGNGVYEDVGSESGLANAVTFDSIGQKKFKLVAVFTDNTTEEVTDQATWYPPERNNVVKRVSNGVVEALSSGDSNMNVHYANLGTYVYMKVRTPGLTLVSDDMNAVDSQGNLKLSSSQSKTVKAYYVDENGTSATDVTDKIAQVDSADANIAIIDASSGSISVKGGSNDGVTTVTATYNGHTASLPVVVRTVKKLEVVGVLNDEVNSNVLYYAYDGTYKTSYQSMRVLATMGDGSVSDVTAQAVFSYTDTDVGSVNNGLFYIKATGTATVTVTYQNLLQTFTLQVVPQASTYPVAVYASTTALTSDATAAQELAQNNNIRPIIVDSNLIIEFNANLAGSQTIYVYNDANVANPWHVLHETNSANAKQLSMSMDLVVIPSGLHSITIVGLKDANNQSLNPVTVFFYKP